MKRLLFGISFISCMGLAFAVQEYHFNLGYILGAVVLALHFLVGVLFFTRKGVNQ